MTTRPQDTHQQTDPGLAGGAPSNRQQGSDSFPTVLMFLAAGIGLAGSLVFNLVLREQNTMLAFDSAHYFRSVQLLYEFLGGKAPAAVGAELSQFLAIDGPVLPMFGSLAYFLSGKAPSPEFLQPLVVLQSVMHALSTAAVFTLSWRATRHRLWCTIAALTFATGMGVIASGRFLTESFATAALCGLVVHMSGRRMASPLQPIRTLASIPSAGADSDSHAHARSDSRLDDSHPDVDTRPDTEPMAKTVLWLIGAGALNGLVLLCRPALAPAVLLVDLVTFAWPTASPHPLWKRGVTWFSGMVLGGALVLAPCMVLNYCAAHKLSCIPERLPGWNIALGSDIETDGWSAVPVPALLDLNYWDKPTSIMYGVYKNHPQEFLSLTVRKAFRMFASPWNDFKQPLLGISPLIQLMSHRLLVLLAIAGGLLALVQAAATTRKTADAALMSACLSLAALSAHFVFVPFEAIPRYVYSSVPFMLVLAALFLNSTITSSHRQQKAGLWSVYLPLVILIPLSVLSLTPFTIQLNENFLAAKNLNIFALASLSISFFAGVLFWVARWSADRQSARMAGLLGAITALSVAAFSWSFVVNKHNKEEWSTAVGASERLERRLQIDTRAQAQQLKPAWMAVLVDGNEDLAKAQFTVNGKALKGKLISIYDVPHPYIYQRTLLHTIDSQADAQGGGRSRIRQWRVINVPLEYVNATGTNVLSVTGATASGRIYGEFTNPQETRTHLPALQSFALCKLQSTLVDGDPRPIDWIGAPIVDAESYRLTDEKKSFDLSNAPGKQIGQYRLHLLIGYSDSGTTEGRCCTEGMTFDVPFVATF